MVCNLLIVSISATIRLDFPIETDMSEYSASEALALWKHASNMLGWNKANRHALYGLGFSLWDSMQRSKEGLLFILDGNAPEALAIEESIKIIRKKPEWLTRAECNLFLEALATSSHISEDVAISILEYAPVFAKALLAGNPKLSPRAVEVILSSGTTKTLVALSKNPRLPEFAFQELLKIKNSEIHNNLVMSAPHASPDTVSRYSSLLSKSSLISTDMISYMKGSLLTESDASVHVDSWILYNNRAGLVGLARNSQCSEEIANKIIDLGDYQMLMGLAGNPRTGIESLALLAHPFRHESIKLNVASNPSVNTELSARLLVDESPNVRATVLDHQLNLSPSLLTEVLFDEDNEDVISRVYVHASSTGTMKINMLPRITNPQAIRDIVKTLSSQPAEFFHYALALDPSCLGYLVQHPDCPSEFVEQAKASSLITEQIAANARLIPVIK